MADIPTLEDAFDARRARRARNVRRVGLALLAVPVVAGLLGWLGPTVDEATVTGADGVTLTAQYPRATRSSIMTPLLFRVTKPGGFGEDPVVIRIDRSLMDHLDFQNWYPVPSAETNDGEFLRYEFDPPEGETLVVSLDARTGPNQGFSMTDHRIAVLDGRAPTAQVEWTLVVWP